MAEKAKKAATSGYGKPGHNRGNIRLYRKIIEHDHDPDMDDICCVIAKEDPTVGQAAMLSGAGNQTITIWQKKKTRRPQHLTMKAKLAGMGYSVTSRSRRSITRPRWRRRNAGTRSASPTVRRCAVSDLAPGRVFFRRGD